MKRETMKFSEALNDKPEEEAPPPAAVKPLDVEAVKKQLEPYKAEIDKMVDLARAHEVADDDADKQAVAMAGEAKKLHNRIEGLRKDIVADPNQFVRAVNNLAKEYNKPLKEIENDLKRKSGHYKYQKEQERREQERKAQEEAAKLQAKLVKEAKKKKTEPVIVPIPVMPKQDTVTRAETGASSHIRKQWKGEIEEPEKVPREYCQPSQQLINQAVKQGIREIPGVKIFEDISSVIRT